VAIVKSKIEKAISVALKIHKNQRRKGDNITAYVAHPIGVGFLLARYTQKEDVIIAALLHDAIEDTDYPAQKIRQEFGDLALRLIREVSDKYPLDPWQKRKNEYLRNIKKASFDACLIACADKINNLISISQSYLKLGDSIWKRFDAPKEDMLGFYADIHKIIRKRFKHPLALELGKALQEAKTILAKKKHA